MTETKAFTLVRNRRCKSVTVVVTTKPRKCLVFMLVYDDGKYQWFKFMTAKILRGKTESDIQEWCVTALRSCLYVTLDNWRVEKAWMKLFPKSDFQEIARTAIGRDS